MAAGDALSLRARVRGRVQGVGFRWFVQEKAQSLGLSGWVRNLGDGSVELEASGPKGGLKSLISALEQGPSSARIEAVEAEWGGPKPASGGFHIRG
mgnify:CR=1 FL=1